MGILPIAGRSKLFSVLNLDNLGTQAFIVLIPFLAMVHPSMTVRA